MPKKEREQKPKRSIDELFTLVTEVNPAAGTAMVMFLMKETEDGQRVDYDDSLIVGERIVIGKDDTSADDSEFFLENPLFNRLRRMGYTDKQISIFLFRSLRNIRLAS